MHVTRIPRKLDSDALRILQGGLARVAFTEPAQRVRFLCVLAHHTEQQTLSEVAAKHSVSRRIVAKWVSAFRDGGMDALTHSGKRGRKPGLPINGFLSLCGFVAVTPKPSVRLVQQWLSRHLGAEISSSLARHWRSKAMRQSGIKIVRRSRAVKANERNQ